MTSEADHKKIDSNTLTKKANAKTEAIKSKQRVADRKAKSNKNKAVRAKGEGTSISFLTLLMIVVGFVLIVMIVIYFNKKNGNKSEDDFEEASFGIQHFRVSRNNNRFDSGAFWFEGIYFHNQCTFIDVMGIIIQMLCIWIITVNMDVVKGVTQL